MNNLENIELLTSVRMSMPEPALASIHEMQTNEEDDNNTTTSNGHGTDDQDATTSRLYDLVIFGASGCVGQFLVEELVLVLDKFYSAATNQSRSSTSFGRNFLSPIREPSQFAQNRRSSVPKQISNVKIAIAGRSAVKLSETLCKAELATGVRDLSIQVPIILADLNQHRSLLDMCSKSHVIVNCAGPYSAYGEALIKACIEMRTSYIDLSHETTFIERMQAKYSDAAQRAGIYIINGCGFLSMSAEMGLNFVKQVADGRITEVQIVTNISDSQATYKPSPDSAQARSCGIIPPSMWNSLLLDRAEQVSRANKPRLDVIPPRKRRELEGAGKKLQRKDTATLVKDLVQVRNESRTGLVHMFKGFANPSTRFCLPLNGLTSEESQLIRSEMVNYELRSPDLDSDKGWSPIRCSSFITMKNFSTLIVALIWLVVFNVLVKIGPVRSLMRTFPALPTCGQVSQKNKKVTRDSLSHIKFCQTFIVNGTPGDHSGDPLEERSKGTLRRPEQLLVARVVGPEPSHIATATFAVQAALTVLLEKDHLPSSGGVLTPGVSFLETNVIYQLRRRNIKFEVMKKA